MINQINTLILTFAMLNIVTFNVNGMNSCEKYAKVVSTLKDIYCDIALIQETHWEENHKVQSALWEGDIYSSSFKRGSRGVAIFISTKYRRNIESIEKDIEGRFIIIKMKIDDELYTIASIYASNVPKERCMLIEKLKTKIDRNERNIVGGDFNIWQSEIEINRNLVWFRDSSRRVFLEFQEEKDLTDIWRKRHPYDHTFSRHQFVQNMLKQSRIDLFLTSQSICNKVVNITYKPTMISDHCILIMRTNFQQIERGPGMWTLNCMHLENNEFCNKVETCIQQQIQCPLYDTDPLIWWDNTKYKIKKIAQIFGKEKAKERNREMNKIQNKLSEYYSKTKYCIDDNLLNKIRHLEEELQVVEEIKCKGAILRSKAKWATECDRNTKFFLQLESNRQNNNVMKELVDENKIPHRDTDSIMDIEYRYYKNLYAQEEIDKGSTEELLSTVDISVSEDGKITCEKNINSKEIKNALFGMSPKKV